MLNKYTKIDDVKISDEYNTTGDALTQLNGKESGGLGVDTVQNFKNSTLPSTGGIGTLMFVLCGGVAAGIAGVYLVSKKKTREEEV